MQVRVAGPLKAQLHAVSAAAEDLLVRKFVEWKSGDPDGHYWFSRDVRGDDGNLCHVHLIPGNVQADRDRWDKFWYRKPQRPWLRRSDRYLLYADGGRHGFLLIALLEDPGAHQLWTPAGKNARENLEIVAENFVYLGRVP